MKTTSITVSVAVFLSLAACELEDGIDDNALDGADAGQGDSELELAVMIPGTTYTVGPWTSKSSCDAGKQASCDATCAANAPAGKVVKSATPKECKRQGTTEPPQWYARCRCVYKRAPRCAALDLDSEQIECDDVDEFDVEVLE